ncbi:MAG: ABC transporter substrate-binding protein, partial [Gammaproteobacteria bacterium]
MRKFAFLNLLVVLAIVLAACGGAATEAPPADVEPPPEPTEDTGDAIVAEEDTPVPVPTADPTSANEAPMLQAMVSAGEIPPLDERLPVDVQTIAVEDSIGQYGGTWYNVTSGDDPGNIKMAFYEPPIRWRADLTGYEPGLAKDYEWSADGTEVTLHLREGV